MYPDIFENASIFIRFGSGQRPHVDGVSVTKNETSFSDLFENAVFMLSCGRVKTELFENVDVTASIYCVSEGYQSMCMDLWGSREGTLLLWFLLLQFEHLSSHVAPSLCGRGYFRKRSSYERGYFLYG